MFNMQMLTAVSVCSFDFILIVSASKLYGCICLVTNARGHSCVFSSGVFPLSRLTVWRLASQTQAFHSINSETSFHARLF